MEKTSMIECLSSDFKCLTSGYLANYEFRDLEIVDIKKLRILKNSHVATRHVLMSERKSNGVLAPISQYRRYFNCF